MACPARRRSTPDVMPARTGEDAGKAFVIALSYLSYMAAAAGPIAGLGVESLTPELLVLLVSATPILEMKAGIPVGIAAGLPLLQTTLLAIAGTCLQIPLNLLGMILLDRGARRVSWARDLLEWSNRRTERYRHLIDRFGVFGVALVVGVPLPGTGLWTGTVAGHLLTLPYWTIARGLVLGTVMAALIVALLTGSVVAVLQ
jgi:uncharacterized membrane protein